MVFLALRTIWRLATSPTKFLTGSTTDGVMFLPVSAAGITLGRPPSITATTEFVVPKSIPTILLISLSFLCNLYSSMPDYRPARKSPPGQGNLFYFPFSLTFIDNLYGLMKLGVKFLLRLYLNFFD